ncbi:MAG TPA: SRPBCC family protein [Povalibacter sp.]|nr:SRPBCC family protein [Povalibacter sp.]
MRKSVQVNASAARAFEAFTSGFNRWWPRTHHIGKAPMVEAVMEPFVGGRWYERDEDGSECDWGQVLEWEPPARLVLAWRVNGNAAYDPAVSSTVEIRFIAVSDKVTRVELEHRDLDRLGEKGVAIREMVGSPNGWGLVLQTYAGSVPDEN